MKRAIFLGLLVALVSLGLSPLLGQGKWDKRRDWELKEFQKFEKKVKDSALRSDWKSAAYYLKTLDWYIKKWDKEGVLSSLKGQKALKSFEKYEKMVLAKTLPIEKKVWYVRREKGKARRGGTKEKPGKFLWRQINDGTIGDEFRISGPFYGWRGSGKLEVTKAHLTLKGGYNFDFTKWNPVQYPTLFSRDKGAQTNVLGRTMLSIKQGHGFVVDGLIFDQKGLNIYKTDGNMDVGRSAQTPIITISFRGKMAIRNCVFMNGSWGGIRIFAEGPGEAIIENCVFINCIAFGVECTTGDPKAKFIVRNNTFAMIQPWRSVVGTGINLGSKGILEARNNIFAYSDVGVTSVFSNNNVTLVGNKGHFLSSCFYYYSEGSKMAKASVKDLEEVDVKGDIEGNEMINPELTLDPISLLKFLKNTGLYGIKKDVLQKEIARVEGQVKSSSTPPVTKKEPPKKVAPPKKKEDDPFGGGFGGDKKDAKKDEKKKDDPFGGGFGDDKKNGKKPPVKKASGVSGGVVPAGEYYGQVYPWEKGWVFPANSGCKAGAKGF